MNLQQILNKDQLSKEELLFLLHLEEGNDLNLLFEKSNAVRELYLGRSNSKIAAFQFSNHCENNCLYCELREDSLAVPRYRLTPDEILHKIKIIVGKNISNIILQSGADSYYDTDMISFLIYRIKKEYDVQITLHLLQRGFDEYRAWKFSGADNYMLKFNTSNKENFSIFNKVNKLEDRVSHIKYLKRIGYQICTGNIIGMPHQTMDDIADDLILINSINPEFVFNTPFVPHYFSKYRNHPKIKLSEMLKIIAITRLLQKKSDIIISDSTDLFNFYEKKELFEAGANSLLIECSGNNKNDETFLKLGRTFNPTENKFLN